MRTPFLRTRPRVAAVATVLALFVLGACGGEADRSSSGPRSSAQQGTSGQAGAHTVGGGVGGAVDAQQQSTRGTAPRPAASPAPAPAAPALPDKIVKTADIGLEVKDGEFDAAWIRVFQTATRFSGYVASSNRGRPQPLGAERTDRELAFGDVTIRVPVARFEPAMNELRTVGKVTGDVSNSEDVTQQYVDLTSRIRHNRAQEAVLVRLMGRARTIQETLVVQAELSKVQLQIEELTGKLNALNGRADLSTITVHLAERGAAVATAKEKPGPSFSKAWDTAVVGLKRIATAVVIVVPLVAPFALLGAMGWMLLRRRLRARPAARAEA